MYRLISKKNPVRLTFHIDFINTLFQDGAALLSSGTALAFGLSVAVICVLCFGLFWMEESDDRQITGRSQWYQPAPTILWRQQPPVTTNAIYLGSGAVASGDNGTKTNETRRNIVI